MERIKNLRIIVYIIMGVAVSQFGLLVALFYPANTLIWLALGLLGILFIYLSVLSLALIRVLKKRDIK